MCYHNYINLSRPLVGFQNTSRYGKYVYVSHHERVSECHSGRIQNQHSSVLPRRSWIGFPGVGDPCRQIKTRAGARISRDWVATLARLTMSSSIPGDPVASPGGGLHVSRDGVLAGSEGASMPAGGLGSPGCCVPVSDRAMRELWGMRLYASW